MKNNYLINRIGLNSKTLIYLFVILLTSLSTQQIQAQLFDSFEMEGNALDEAPITNDAENLFTGTFNTSVFGNNYIDFTFIADGSSSSTDDIATGGGSKDVLDISSWLHTVGSVPDKNQLVDGMGAAFVDKTTGHPMVYIGIDRFDGSGAASMGFWFLGQKIKMETAGPLAGKYVNTETGGLATHVAGDILVIADFSGSSTPQIAVYGWDPAQANNLVVLSAPGINDCAVALNGDAFCASANSTTYAAPWPYTNKNGTSDHEPGLFLEAIIDLEVLLGPNLACFSTFLVESRASASVTAAQKDVAIGALKGCDLTINKTGATLSKEGDKVTYQFEITNPAVIPLSVDSLIDDVLGDLTSEVIADGGLLVRGQTSVFVDYEWTVPAGYFTSNNPLTNTAVLIYSPPNGVATVDTQVQDTHTLELFSPDISVTKTANVTEAILTDVVTYTYTINNNSLASPTLGSPDLVLSTSYSNAPVPIGQEIEDVAGTSTFTGFDVFVGDAGATEGNNLVFDVVLSSAAAGNVTVNLATTDGSAISGADYTGGAYSVVISAGSTAGTITIPTLVNAPLTESNENFTVAITSVTSTSGADTFDDTSDTGTGTVIEAGHVYDDVLGDITAQAIAGGCTTIAAGGSCTFTFDYTITTADTDAILNNTDPLTNTVDVLSHPEGFPNDIAATDNYTVNILPSSDLSLTKTVDNATPNVDDIVVFTLTLTNSGPDEPTGVRILDILQTGLTYDATNSVLAGGVYDENTGILDLSSVTISAPLTLEIKIAAKVGPNCGTIINNAEVYSSSLPDPDSTPNSGN